MQHARGIVPKYLVTLKVQGRSLEFEVDSGAAFTVISEDTYRKTWPSKPHRLQKEDVTLRTWTGEGLRVLGSAEVEVRHKSKDYLLPLMVRSGTGCNLMGRNWFPALKIQLSGLHHLSPRQQVRKVLQAHEAVFKSDITGYTGPPVKLELKEPTTPRFLKARTIPFALHPVVECQLMALQKQGILEPVQHSTWATPVVVVRKTDGSVRLCGDYRSTVNLAAKPAAYPLPTPTEALSNLRGGTVFSTLDLAQAYQQLRVTDTTAEMLTINTIKGLFRVKRLPFGVAAAPAIFQKVMDMTLAGIPGVAAYLDDVIISGANAEEHAY